MTATAHALVGGVIASQIQNPALGISLSALSHPVLDLIPHWDFGWGWRKKTKLKLFLQASFDLGLGILLAYFLFGRNVDIWYFLLCVLAAEIWDIMEAPYWFFNWKFFPFGLIYKIQSSCQGKAKLPWGIVTQVVSVFAVILIFELVKIA